MKDIDRERYTGKREQDETAEPVSTRCEKVGRVVSEPHARGDTPDEDLSKSTVGLSVLDFLRVGELHMATRHTTRRSGLAREEQPCEGLPSKYLDVHVRVRRDKVALVLEAPLELDVDNLASKVVKERLGVHGSLGASEEASAFRPD